MKIKNLFCANNGALSLLAVAIAVWASGTEAATISLTDATPGTSNVYTHTTGATDDPNATYTNGVTTDTAGNYFAGNSVTSGTLSYTFDLAARADNLNLTGASLFANSYFGATSPTDGISLDYTLSGGNTGSGNLFTLFTSNYTFNNVDIPSFNENIALTPANTDTFVTITFTTSSATGNDFQEQILRNTEPFVATAAFAVPEPSSVVALCGLGAIGLFLYVHRRRKT